MLKLFTLFFSVLLGSAIAHKQKHTADIDDTSKYPLVPPVAFTPLSARIPSDVHHGVIVDAGSGGSRLHIFKWQPRIFHDLPPPISYPLNKETWTQRMAPGVSDFADRPKDVVDYLKVLIDFAKKELANTTDDWQYYPFYFKATGGMREVPYVKREILMTEIRNVLFDKNINPFYFQYDFARVISGEEEAAYSWSGTNFLMGTLLPPSVGEGGAVSTNSTYGTVDLGGASTQISFFLPSQDISEGLYKLQVGSERHWNIYATSYLQFGYNSAKARYQQDLISNRISTTSKDGSRSKDAATRGDMHNAITACYFSGYSESVPFTFSNGSSSMYTVSGPSKASKDQFDQCYASIQPLLMKDINAFCNWVYDGQCSIGGAYQPPLPDPKTHRYIGTSSYKYAWNFAQMDTIGSLKEFRNKSRDVCRMSYKEAIKYRDHMNTSLYNLNGDSALTDTLLPYYCFLSAYSLLLLQDGYGFPDETVLQVTNVLNGHKVGWVLGAMLFEINSLPWLYVPRESSKSWGQIMFALFIGGAIGSMWVSCYWGVKNPTPDADDEDAPVLTEQQPLMGGGSGSGYQSAA